MKNEHDITDNSTFSLWPGLDFIEKIKPQNYATHSFSSQYGYLCYIALYQFAVAFCVGKKVLDAASGLGFGSYLLAHKAQHVTGVEIEKDVIEYAKKNYKKENLDFILADATSMNFEDGMFDVVVSLETFEHIPPGKALQFIKELKRVLKQQGTLIISTPNHNVYSRITRTPDHVNELNVDDFRKLISSEFQENSPYYQRKGVLQTTGKYFSVVSKDKLKLRRFVPHWLRNKIRKAAAPQLQKEPAEILKEVQVFKATTEKDVKDAVFQVWVCRNETGAV